MDVLRTKKERRGERSGAAAATTAGAGGKSSGGRHRRLAVSSLENNEKMMKMSGGRVNRATERRFSSFRVKISDAPKQRPTGSLDKNYSSVMINKDTPNLECGREKFHRIELISAHKTAHWLLEYWLHRAPSNNKKQPNS